MFELDPNAMVLTLIGLLVYLTISHFAVNRPKAKRTVVDLKRRLSERLQEAVGDVSRYEAKAAQGVAGYNPGGNVAIVKIEFHDWFEGFSTGLHSAVPHAIREKLNLHTYDDMLRTIDPNHNPSLWSQDLKIRANRW